MFSSDFFYITSWEFLVHFSQNSDIFVLRRDMFAKLKRLSDSFGVFFLKGSVLSVGPWASQARILYM